MSHDPTITLYIPSYNQARYLVEAIKSALRQTRMPDEIIIIDDASDDGSCDIIERYASLHRGLIRPIYHKQRLGIGSVRYRAVEESRGEFITYLDGDDRYYPNKIKREMQALMARPDAGYAYSNFEFITEDGESFRKWYEHGPLPDGSLFEHVAAMDFSGGVSSRCELVRKEILTSRGHYEPGMDMYQVLDVMLRVAWVAPGVPVSQVLHQYRRHSGGIHRKIYSEHYKYLNWIYRKNQAILKGDMSSPEGRARAGFERRMSDYARRAIKQIAAGHDDRHELRRCLEGALRYRPTLAFSPKFVFRAIRAILRRPRRAKESRA